MEDMYAVIRRQLGLFEQIRRNLKDGYTVELVADDDGPGTAVARILNADGSVECQCSLFDIKASSFSEFIHRLVVVRAREYAQCNHAWGNIRDAVTVLSDTSKDIRYVQIEVDDSKLEIRNGWAYVINGSIFGVGSTVCDVAVFLLRQLDKGVIVEVGHCVANKVSTFTLGS